MLKSLFRRKNIEPLSNENADNSMEDSQGANEQDSQQAVVVRPIDEVLDKLCEDLDPLDSDNYTVSVAEVQYLWRRYQQLLQESSDITASNDVLTQEPFVSNYFLRQVWKTIPRDNKGCVTFPAFFGVVKWWQTVDQQTKLKGIFQLLNNGQPLDTEALKPVLKNIDNSLDEETVSRRAEILLLNLDNKNQGYIDEGQWLQGMSRLSSEEIQNLTHFFILPNVSEHQPEHSSTPVPEEMLVMISSKIGARDWKPLAQKLGFSDKEIKYFKLKYPNRSREQTYQMLKHYSEKDGATKQVLEFDLRRCAMEDVIVSLQNE